MYISKHANNNDNNNEAHNNNHTNSDDNIITIITVIIIIIIIDNSSRPRSTASGTHEWSPHLPGARGAVAAIGKGQMGSALMGSLQMSVFFDRGTCWVLLLTYVYLPKRARAYLFPQSVKLDYLCSGPIN